jgi:hypothetical protein
LSASVEEKRLAVEIIATLVNIKDTMVDLILKPAGVPAEIYKPIIHKRDEETGKTLSKRKLAPLILHALEERGDSKPILRAIIKIAADWSDFHLAQDEFVARATVQKAREAQGTIKLMEVREAKQRAIAQKQELEKMEHERADFLKRNSELLLMMFDDLTQSKGAQWRGYVLQELLERVFTLHEIPVTKSFTRNNGGANRRKIRT